MARKDVDIDFDSKVLDALIRNSGGNVAEAVAKTAFSVEARAKVQIQRMEAIDTGAMLNSTATSLKQGGDVRAAITAAQAKRPGVVTTPLPVPTDDHTAYVGPQVEYAIEVHNGSGTMPARPFLLQAVRDTEQEFRDHLAKAVKPK